MSNTLAEDRYEWMKNPFLRREKGDYTPFYVAITICTILGFFIIALNIYLCCSRYRDYWCDSNTGNRWILPIWVKLPNKQPPLDLTELDEAWIPEKITEFEYPDNYYSEYETPSLRSQQEEFVELVQQKIFQKKESDL